MSHHEKTSPDLTSPSNGSDSSRERRKSAVSSHTTPQAHPISTTVVAETPPPDPFLTRQRTSSALEEPGRQESSASNTTQVARHWSVFYPEGIEVLPPIAMHYLHLGCWCTVAGGWDYFAHRQLKRGEVVGHRVHWLHTALPRDRFVFLIDPVEAQGEASLWGMIWKSIYGKPPAFAYARGKLLWRIQESSFAEEWHYWRKHGKQQQNHAPSSNPRTLGVEVVEVLHADITAMDYAPGITSARLALETKVASASWFASADEAYAFYGCLDKSPSFNNTTVHSDHSEYGVPNASASLLTTQPASAHQQPQSQGCSSLHLWNGSELSEEGSRNGSKDGQRDGGDEMDVTLGVVVREPSSTLSADHQPPSPRPSPCLNGTLGPLDMSIGGPSELFLPPSTAQCLEGQPPPRSHHQGRPSDANALSALATPNASPSIRPSVRHSRTATLENDAETRFAASAAAGLLHSANNGTSSHKPLETLQHFNTMVTIYTQDPHFNAALREVLMPEPGTCPFTASVQEQKRLLSMYESGMPSWTIFFSRYGLPYRRWFRLVAVMLVNIWPLIALCVGLYDLYKHMPYLKEFLADTLTPLTSWMDHHFTLRISMLVTYLVTVSYTVLQALHSFVKSIAALINFVIAPLIPLLQLLSIVRYPLLFLWTTVTVILGPLFTLLWTVWAAVSMILSGPFKALYYLFRTIGFVAGPSPAAASAAVQQASFFVVWWRSWIDFWDKVARPIKNVAKAAYDGIVHVGVSIVRREASIRRWYTAKLSVISIAAEMYIDCVHQNWLLFTSLPSWKSIAIGLAIVLWSTAGPLWLYFVLGSGVDEVHSYAVVEATRQSSCGPR